MGEEVTIYIGGVFASREGAVVKTLLGSCIAACLWDPQSGVGGMNHFMLPRPGNAESESDAPRFGVHAMELLIGKIQRLGGDRRTVQGKIFGGGHVLQIAGSGDDVPTQNIQFIRQFMACEGIPVVAEDLGGRTARQVLFCTDSGKVLLKRLPPTRFTPVVAEQRHQRDAECIQTKVGDVTLFDD
jgi:chemotaxis protein CheD